jgi:hypothetical protein
VVKIVQYLCEFVFVFLYIIQTFKSKWFSLVLVESLIQYGTDAVYFTEEHSVLILDMLPPYTKLICIQSNIKAVLICIVFVEDLLGDGQT